MRQVGGWYYAEEKDRNELLEIFYELMVEDLLTDACERWLGKSPLPDDVKKLVHEEAVRICKEKKQMDKPTIYAIDFDGTIVRNKWPEIGEPNAAIIHFVRTLQEKGDKWILYTMREGDKLQEALKFLEEHELKPDAVNDNLPELIKAFGSNPRKVYADVYIDDHNAGGLRLV